MEIADGRSRDVQSTSRDESTSTVPTLATHTVFNQPPALAGYNAFTTDQMLVDCVEREGAQWHVEQLQSLGAIVGSEEAQQWGDEANVNIPVLHTHDRYGHRIDEVTFHPAWHALLQLAVSHGAHALSWRNDDRLDKDTDADKSTGKGTHVARAAAFYLCSQVEAGHGCPISMTHAAYPVLQKHAPAVSAWLPRLSSLTYDPGLRPIDQKSGILCGMGMTEKQGGSDVRANTTVALPTQEYMGAQRVYLLTGHKWFCSAPMCDLFLVLAQAPEGLSCFLVPRMLPDSMRNRFAIQRLKEKLGNRSNASSEVEFTQTWGLLLGEAGHGVRTIMEMVNYTRLDCVLGSAALMRQALLQALHHTRHRSAFGRHLSEQPLMRNVLADLAIESEAATLLAFRLAGACDRAGQDPVEGLLKRLGTAIGKYWVTKRAPVHIAEALECLGGNGYVEENMLPRLYREAPVNSIWEGSGNVNCLDVLRALARDPQSLDLFNQMLSPVRSADTRLDAAITRLQNSLRQTDELEWRARSLVEQMALVLQGALLIQYGPSALADAFCATRLNGEWGRAFGTLPPGLKITEILSYALA